MEFLQELEYWHWLLLGVVLLILEVFSPGVFFMWLGLAAGLTGVALLLEPGLGWETQLLLFGVAGVVLALLGHRLVSRRSTPSDEPHLNRRGEQYVGRVFTLDAAIVNNQGKVRVDDSTWKIRGEDCPAGTRVRVIGVDGVVLLVDAMDAADR
jgi:membrane protein implicated in regulation of membrane protease activity